MLTGNLEVNAVLKLSAGLDGLLDFEAGGYGSDPHEERSDLVEIAERARGEALRRAGGHRARGRHPARRAGGTRRGGRAVAVATGPYAVDQLRDADAVLEDLREPAHWSRP